jgi:subtilisin family serine protease
MPGGRRVTERKKRFLIAPRQPFGPISPLTMQAVGIQPLPLSAIEQALRAHPEIEIEDIVGAKSTVGMMAEGRGPGAEGVLVARMTEQIAREVHQQGQGRLLVERDYHLQLYDPMLRQPDRVTSVAPYAGPTLDVTITVLGKDGVPQAGAEVSLFGGLMPANGATDADGKVLLTLYGETTHTISGIYVKPKSDYWSFYQRDPDISTEQPNIVTLRALSDWPSLAGFPGQAKLGWGQRAMRLDQLPPNYCGQGIKIAVIDSGAETSHRNLNRIRAGFDIINKRTDRATWNNDELGHGSHCAGIIAGTDPTYGIRGFAPEAEIHVCKLFPGGQVSQLIEALEYCIEHQIDVVNLSLGGIPPSEALEQQILRAKHAGIACIAAAGNSGGPVQYPASSPHVLAVAALGKIDEFPPDSYHVETIGSQADAQGYYTARFSCYGPQVDVCAPGVAVVSAVPPNNFAAWDGTSVAAPHVTGLAALILAHNPEFQTVSRARGAGRVERLFQVIRLSARRVSLGDPAHIGYGMPDALAALGLPLMTDQQHSALQSLLRSLMAGGALGIDAAVPAAFAGMMQQPPLLMQQAAGGMAGMPFGFGMGALRPSGW